MNEYYFTVAYDDYRAEIVLGGEWSLYNLAETITKTVGFDFDHAFEFCDNIKSPYKSKERYTLFFDQEMEDDCDDDDGKTVAGVRDTLVSDVFRAKRKMVFHFDFGDDWFFLITCTAIKESEVKKRFKKVLSTQGTPPEQYPNEEEDDDV